MCLSRRAEGSYSTCSGRSLPDELGRLPREVGGSLFSKISRIDFFLKNLRESFRPAEGSTLDKLKEDFLDLCSYKRVEGSLKGVSLNEQWKVFLDRQEKVFLVLLKKNFF